jgi:hypothetical protein
MFFNNWNVVLGSDVPKNRVLEEFRNKLLNEEEIRKELEKQKVLTDEDFNVLKLEKSDLDIQREKDELINTINEEILGKELTEEEIEEKRRKDEEKKQKNEEERLRKEEEKRKNEEERKAIAEEKFMTEEEKKKRKAEREAEEKEKKEKQKLEEQQKKTEAKKQKDTEEELKKQEKLAEEKKKEIERGLESEKKYETEAERAGIASTTDNGIITKEFNITDTGVSVEYLYSRDYEDLVINKTPVRKNDIDSENDIPKVLTVPKQLQDFSTSDIPQELLVYNRSLENRHIPTILKAEDLFIISKQAVIENNLALLRSIVEKTQNPDFLVDNKYTLLSLAVSNQKLSLIKYLIFNGADINRQDMLGNSPLHDAILTRNGEIIRFLISNGVDLDLQNIDGETPMMLAVKTIQNDIAIHLMKSGANMHLKNSGGSTALDLANQSKNKNLAKIISGIIREEKDR